MERDCFITIDNQWFRMRAAAIIIENDCVLFATNSTVDYLYSIGGAVHINEKAEDAVKREVLEETGVTYQIDRLAVIHENFFVEENLHANKRYCHEVAFYYLMKPRGTQELDSNSYTGGAKEQMRWIPVKDLQRYKAFPSFLSDYLSKPHGGVEHIITDDRQ